MYKLENIKAFRKNYSLFTAPRESFLYFDKTDIMLLSTLEFYMQQAYCLASEEL
jgi:hypothetical protein